MPCKLHGGNQFKKTIDFHFDEKELTQMQLNRAEIKNFRSISDLTIQFQPGCQVLLGINESGKSNILKALHLLDPLIKVQTSDLRIERHDETQVTSGWVRYIFSLENDEIESIFNEIAAHFASPTKLEFLINEGFKPFTLKAWCERQDEILHIVSVPTGTRRNTCWQLSEGVEIRPGWMRNKLATSIDLLTPNGSVTVPPEGFFFNGELPIDLKESFEPMTTAHLQALLDAEKLKIISTNLPKCIFWRYADEYLLPTSLDINAFCATPDSCIPLKSMFELANFPIPALSKTIASARQQGHYRYLQILEKVSAAATMHLRSVWKDNQTIRINLQPNGELLSPVVVDDQVPLDMTNRSDGFKRFVSFLLQISAKVKTTELKNSLILVDEPEIALHPSGCRNLMSELIAIGRTNTTIYSTHSIFMIDKSKIDRHLVVEKRNEVTSLWRADTSRIQDEEVLYSAIGYSVFETLKEQNVIFEGWRDKRLFLIAAEAMANASADIKSKLSKIGMTHAIGVKDVKTVAQFLELASRPCLIISDADTPAVQHKKAHETVGSWGKWQTLQDIFGPGPIVTSEDLIDRQSILRRANNFRKTKQGLGELQETDLDTTKSTIESLTKWIKKAGLTEGTQQENLNELKAFLYDELDRSELNDQVEVLVRYVVDYEFSTDR
jgi:energy-coupling factor transporter ATP-binding protein EcfA2